MMPDSTVLPVLPSSEVLSFDCLIAFIVGLASPRRLRYQRLHHEKDFVHVTAIGIPRGRTQGNRQASSKHESVGRWDGTIQLESNREQLFDRRQSAASLRGRRAERWVRRRWVSWHGRSRFAGGAMTSIGRTNGQTEATATLRARAPVELDVISGRRQPWQNPFEVFVTMLVQTLRLGPR